MPILLLLLVVSVPVFYYVTSAERFRFFLNPINTFWLGYVYFAALEPALRLGDWVSLFGEATFRKALLMYIVAGMAVCVGSRISYADRIASQLPKVRVEHSERRLLFLGFAILFTGLAAHAYIVAISGGWTEYISVGRTSTKYLEFSAYINSLVYFEPLGILVLLAYCQSKRAGHLLRVLVICLFGLQALWFLYSGTRSGMIALTVIYFGAKYGPIRKNPRSVELAVAVVSLVVIVGFIQTYRYEFFGGQFNNSESPDELLANSLRSYVGDATESDVPVGSEFGMTLAAAEYIPSTLPFEYGYQFLEIFTRGIPRQLWPEKVYPEGESWDSFHRVAGTSQSLNSAGLLAGPTAGFAAKWYYAGGWIGLLIGGLTAGFALRIAYGWTSRIPGMTGAIIATATANIGFSEVLTPVTWIVSWLPSFGLVVLLTVMVMRETKVPLGFQSVRQLREARARRPLHIEE